MIIRLVEGLLKRTAMCVAGFVPDDMALRITSEKTKEYQCDCLGMSATD
jgi:hypothetical protein